MPEACTDVEHAEASRIRLAFERQVVFRPHLALHHVEPSRLHAEELGVLIRDDLERQPIEERQPAPRPVAPPVVRVAGEGEPLARLVLRQHERAEPRHLPRGRLRTPGGGEAPVLQRAGQAVLRVDGQVVEHPQARPVRLRET